jgi:hypothetical protein
LPIKNFQNEENRAAELIIANKELAFQNDEKKIVQLINNLQIKNLLFKMEKENRCSRISCCK